MSNTLALVYLSRGIDNGLSSAKKFFNAYETKSPGYPHQLVVIAKGWDNITEYEEMVHLAQKYGAQIKNLPDDGYDWGAYMRISTILKHNYVCFVNTHSIPLVEGWLYNLIQPALQNPDYSIIGATASMESFVPIIPLPSNNNKRNTSFWYTLRFIRNIVKLVINIWNYPLFPNPHLRSNAFLVRRNILIEYISSRKIPKSKNQAHCLESGRIGISNYLRGKGYELIVAGANGCSYPISQWMQSGVFRVPAQNNLLVSDNQTRDYENSEIYKKRILEKSAWGKSLS